MPYGVAGAEIYAGIKKTATWGTALALGANNGLMILPTTLKRETEAMVDDSLGSYWPKDGDLGPIKVGGQIPCYLRYDSLDLMIALFMGIAGAPTQQGGTAAYAYTYKWDTDTDGLFAVFAKNMKNYIEEYPSIKITGMTIKGEVGKPLQILFDVLANNKIKDSAVNTLVTFPNVTYFEQENRVKYSQGAFRMNAKSGDALDSGDLIYPNSFELIAKRKLSGVYDGQNKFTSGSNVQDLIDEPQNDGAPEIDLKLTFPRHTGVTNLTILDGDTRQKMDMTFTGGVIEGAYYRTFKLQFPHLQLVNVDPADETGAIKEPLEFKVHGSVTAPTGMSNVIEPFWVSGINRLTTNPLA